MAVLGCGGVTCDLQVVDINLLKLAPTAIGIAEAGHNAVTKYMACLWDS